MMMVMVIVMTMVMTMMAMMVMVTTMMIISMVLVHLLTSSVRALATSLPRKQQWSGAVILFCKDHGISESVLAKRFALFFCKSKDFWILLQNTKAMKEYSKAMWAAKVAVHCFRPCRDAT